MIKLAAEVERHVVAGGGEWHADGAAELLFAKIPDPLATETLIEEGRAFFGERA